MTTQTLQCDMRAECRNPVTHIGAKGYAYCAEHAPCRQGWERTRKLRAWELAIMHAGIPLPSYEPQPMAQALADWSTSSETPGVARNDEVDALIYKAREAGVTP